MFCDYKISGIQDLRNKVIVEYRIYEGDYSIVEGEKIYMRTGVIDSGSVELDESPPDEKHIDKKLKEIILEKKGDREVIPECL
jgi:hypothetical protein